MRASSLKSRFSEGYLNEKSQLIKQEANAMSVPVQAVIKNPILRGFNPDPSILRVGEDYYIATSTFEWFPGVQIHHSRDLVHWRLLTRPLDRTSQLNMVGNPDSGGIWAPCLSYSDGLYYLIYTDVKYWRQDPYKIAYNYLVTAEAITGPWSEPVFLNSSGFDPSLYHDDDGRKWLVNMIWDHRHLHNRFAGILLQEYDTQKQRLVGPIKNIFMGTEIGLVEGPHIYKRNGFYYLLTAEGGTQYEHAVSLCRSRSIDGPYELYGANPVLTSYGNREIVLQKSGHGSLVETQTGEWYLAHLCGRPVDGTHCTLGRETALQKCVWKEDGWLYLEHGGNKPSEIIPIPEGIEPHPFDEPAWDGFFKQDELDLNFQSLRRPITGDWLCLKSRPGYLRLYGNEPTVSLFRQSLIARRVQAFDVEVETCVEFTPSSFQQMAGLIAYYDTENHYYLRISHDESIGRNLNIIATDAARSSEVMEEDVPISPEGAVRLKLRFTKTRLQFFYAPETGDWKPVGPELNGAILSDDYNELGFTGAFVGLCAQDMTGSNCPADFSCFHYVER